MIHAVLLLTLGSSGLAAPPRYEAQIIPADGYRTMWPMGLTDAGEIVLYEGFDQEVCLWSPAGGFHCTDQAYNLEFGGSSPSGLVTGTYSRDFRNRAFVWDGTSIAEVPLIVADGPHMRGQAISDSGYVAGTSENGWFGTASGGDWMTATGYCRPPECWEVYRVSGVSDSGLVVGGGHNAATPDLTQAQAFVWSGGTFTHIPSLDDDPYGTALEVLSDGTVLAASGTGVISHTGTTNDYIFADARAFTWRDGAVDRLAPEPFMPLAMNEQGWVVGAVGDPFADGSTGARLWIEDTLYDLNDLVVDDIGPINGAFSINADGDIAAFSDGFPVLLTALPPGTVDIAVAVAGTVGANAEITFQVTVENQGEAEAAATLTIVPPETTTYVDGIVLPADCVADADVYRVNCAVGTLAVAQSRTFGFRFNHSGVGVYPFDIEVAAADDVDPSDDAVRYEAEVRSFAVTIGEPAAEPTVGVDFDLPVVLDTPSGGALGDVELTLAFAPSVRIPELPSSCVGVPEADAPEFLTGMDCEVSAISGAPIALPSLVPAESGPLAITATAEANGFGVASDTATLDVQPNTSADVGVGFREGDDGSTILLSVYNEGPGEATVHVTGDLDFRPESAPAACPNVDEEIDCELTLRSGATVELPYARWARRFRPSAEVTSEVDDPNLSNNRTEYISDRGCATAPAPPWLALAVGGLLVAVGLGRRTGARSKGD